MYVCHLMIHQYFLLPIKGRRQTVHSSNLQQWSGIVVQCPTSLTFRSLRKIDSLFTLVSLLMTGGLVSLSVYLCLLVLNDLVFGVSSWSCTWSWSHLFGLDINSLMTSEAHLFRPSFFETSIQIITPLCLLKMDCLRVSLITLF